MRPEWVRAVGELLRAREKGLSVRGKGARSQPVVPIRMTREGKSSHARWNAASTNSREAGSELLGVGHV